MASEHVIQEVVIKEDVTRMVIRVCRSRSLLLGTLEGGVLILAIEVDLDHDEDVHCELHHSAHHELERLVLSPTPLTSITK